MSTQLPKDFEITPELRAWDLEMDMEMDLEMDLDLDLANLIYIPSSLTKRQWRGFFNLGVEI